MALTPSALLQCLQSDLAGQGLPTEVGTPLWPDISLREASAQSLLNSFLKKLSVGRTTVTDARAEQKFLACDSACKTWRVDYPFQRDTKLEIITGTVRQYLDDFWHRGGYDLVDSDLEVLERGALGPGVSQLCRGNDFYSKLFASPLTVSDPLLYQWYRRYISKFPHWRDAEQNRISTYGDPVLRLSSRLSFVPKNDEISRCICIEPTLNVFYQLGLGRILEDRLYERFGISLSNQPFKNRALARLGSITDSLATLDLSSASDSISLNMLEWLLPKRFLFWLKRYRSVGVDIKGRGTVELGMVSTMGNGYTFPLQTIIFSAVVLACLAWRGIPAKSIKSGELWSVFGDDIICPSACAEDVVRTLNFLGFTVNQDKSFVKGPFRESCGSDFFKGSNIRGVYVKTLNTPEARYSVINLLARFSTRTGIDLRQTIWSLLNTVEHLFVPPWEDFSAGIHVPESLVRGRLRLDPNGSRVYYARMPRAPRIRFDESGPVGTVVVPRRCKQLIYNPPGLLVGLLQGSIRSGSIGVRKDPVRYSTKRRVAPAWGFYVKPGYESIDYDLDWGRWTTVLEEMFERT